VLQCVAVCCSVSQCVAVCCSVLQCVAVCSRALAVRGPDKSRGACVAVCCSVLQCVEMDGWIETKSEKGKKGGSYGVATISRLLKMLGLVCKKAL